MRNLDFIVCVWYGKPQNCCSRFYLGPWNTKSTNIVVTCYIFWCNKIKLNMTESKWWVRLSVVILAAPSYLVVSVTATASLSYRGRLRSAIATTQIWRALLRLWASAASPLGERCFAFAGPAACNSLPSSVQELTDTTAFKHQLKTVLFQRCYSSSPSFN